MERETKEFITPAGNKVVLRTYLTGKESNELKAIMYADLKINASDAAEGKVSLADIPAAFMIAQQNKAVQFLVVSVNGDTTAPIAKLEELPESEYNAVLAEVQKIRVPFKPGEITAAWDRWFSFGTAEYPEQIIATICREMSWTYETYLAQPTWFVEMVWGAIIGEAKAQARRTS